MIVQQMEAAPGDILKSTEHPDYSMAVPTPDHFIPLLYTAGIAAAENNSETLLRGYSMGSISMTCYGVGMDGIKCEDAEGAAQIPLDIPSDQTNI